MQKVESNHLFPYPKNWLTHQINPPQKTFFTFQEPTPWGLPLSLSPSLSRTPSAGVCVSICRVYSGWAQVDMFWISIKDPNPNNSRIHIGNESEEYSFVDAHLNLATSDSGGWRIPPVMFSSSLSMALCSLHVYIFIFACVFGWMDFFSYTFINFLLLQIVRVVSRMGIGEVWRGEDSDYISFSRKKRGLTFCDLYI